MSLDDAQNGTVTVRNAVVRRRDGARWPHWTVWRVVGAVAALGAVVAFTLLTSFVASIMGYGFFGTAPAPGERTVAAVLWVLAGTGPASVLAVIGALRNDKRWLIPAAIFVFAGVQFAADQLAVTVDRDAIDSWDEGPVFAMIGIHLSLIAGAVAAWYRWGRSRPSR